MGGGIDKKILTEQSLYYGKVIMPKGFEIDQKKLSDDILQTSLNNKKFPFSKTWDMLNTYIIDHIGVKYNLFLTNKQTFGNIYKSNELTLPLKNVNPIDLKNSADFTCLYGVNVNKCFVKIFYDDNRRKNKSWNIELKNNMFILFPSINMYIISNNQKESLNFVQTITYEYK